MDAEYLGEERITVYMFLWLLPILQILANGAKSKRVPEI